MDSECMPDSHYTLPLAGGGQIRVIRLAGSRQFPLPVILAHGTLSNGGTVRSFGDCLAGLGHDTWLLEWGGHAAAHLPVPGVTSKPRPLTTCPGALEFVKEKTAPPGVLGGAFRGGAVAADVHGTASRGPGQFCRIGDPRRPGHLRRPDPET